MSTETKKVKLGFVGCGYMGQLAHLANYAVLPNVELTALADLRPETTKEVAKRYGIKQVFTTHKELLDNADIDAVVAIMWFQLHHNVVPDILEKGKHCITEKAICMQKKNAIKFDEIAKKKKVIYQVGYMKRCDPASVLMKKKIKEWKESKEFGNINYLRVSMPPGDWTLQMDPPINMNDAAVKSDWTAESAPEWMNEKVGKDYWIFVNFYIHQINLIRYLLSEDYKISYIHPKGKILLAESDSGVPIVLEMSMYSVPNEWHEFYTACFDKGKISMALPAPMARQHSGNVRIYQQTKNGPEYIEPVLPQRWSMLEQARYFIETVNRKMDNISPAADAAKDLEIAEEYIKLMLKVK